MAHTIKEIASYVQHPDNYSHFFQGLTLYTTVDTATLRNIMTTVFVLLNIFTVFAGGCFLKERNLRRLRLKRKPVPINHLTSWTSLKGCLIYAWRTFRIPGGHLGFSLMLLTGVFGLAHQYFVNSFIVSALLQSRCPFDAGIVTIRFNGSIVPKPVSTFFAARTVYSALYQSYLNGGQFGIYEKVNNLYSDSCPTEEDVLGRWICSSQSDTIIAKTDWISASAVESYLQQQNFLFTGAYAIQFELIEPDESVLGFLAWSADQPENSGQLWSVRASVSTYLNGSGASPSSTGMVTNLECQLTVSRPSWTPPILPSNSSLNEWCPLTFGSVMTLASGRSYSFWIELMLNAMMMVGGSGNLDRWNQTDVTNAGGHPSYGCVVDGTQIKPEIWVFLMVLVILLVPVIVADIMMFLVPYLFQRSRTDDAGGANLVKEAPSSVEEWQLRVLREMRNDETITFKEIGDYSFIWNTDKYVLSRIPDGGTPRSPAMHKSYSKLTAEHRL